MGSAPSRATSPARSASTAARVITADELDPSLHAAAANRFAATVYVGFEPRTDAARRVAYYATAGFESQGGRALAERIRGAMAATPTGLPVMTHGMRLPVLRETRMTAVVCSLGPVQRVVDAAPVVGDAVVEALAAWAAQPAPGGRGRDRGERTTVTGQAARPVDTAETDVIHSRRQSGPIGR